MFVFSVDVEVVYSYDAEQPDELSIKPGDVIKNVIMAEGGWWEGEIAGKKGMFPDNFVKVVVVVRLFLKFKPVSSLLMKQSTDIAIQMLLFTILEV